MLYDHRIMNDTKKPITKFLKMMSTKQNTFNTSRSRDLNTMNTNNSY